MKGFLILTLALLPASALAANQPSRSYDQSQLRTDVATATFDYADFDHHMYGLTLSLPTETALLPLSESDQITDFRFSVGDRVELGRLAESQLRADQMTSDGYANAVVASVRELTEQFAPVRVLGELTLGGVRYAELCLCPVTVDIEGTAWFNESLFVTCAGRTIQPEDLMARKSLVEGRAMAASSPTSSAAVDYIIVTNEALAEAFAPLAEYKSETGISTKVVPIEDILSSYAGRDTAEQLREYLKTFHSQGGTFVLLGGDETILPIRYAYHYNATTLPAVADLQVCDLYFADLTGDWDVDNDGIWGERYHDAADIVPELNVGRLPFNSVTEVQSYIEKLIEYETNPGRGDLAYLAKAFFFSSDQMRDYGTAGQHALIAEAYPSSFAIDTVSGVEMASGDDPAPTNPDADQTAEILSQGYGIVNVLSHGASNTFCVKTSGINQFPKSAYGANQAAALASNGFASFYYSLACSNGGFERDQAPLNEPEENIVQHLLSQPHAGAIGFVAYSRWGWISSSHLLQKVFFDSLFAHPGRPAIEAMHDSKAAYYYYRDLVYGQNFYGDPTLVVYTVIPQHLSLNLFDRTDGVKATVETAGEPVSDCRLVITANGDLVAEVLTDAHGQAIITCELDPEVEYTVSAMASGACIAQQLYSPTLVTSVEESQALPTSFALQQNYPNPFNPSTTICFELPIASQVELTVYNTLGQTVALLVNDLLPSGLHSVEWDATAMASGVYFYRLATTDHEQTKKMILLR